MPQRRRELGERREHERITQHVAARQTARCIDGLAEEQQVEIERARRETLGPPQPPAFVLDVVELALDVVGPAIRRERADHVQEVGAAEAERGAPVDARAADRSEARLERIDGEPQMALGLDVAADADIDVNHSPPWRARSRLRPPWS